MSCSILEVWRVRRCSAHLQRQEGTADAIERRCAAGAGRSAGTSTASVGQRWCRRCWDGAHDRASNPQRSGHRYQNGGLEQALYEKQRPGAEPFLKTAKSSGSLPWSAAIHRRVSPAGRCVWWLKPNAAAMVPRVEQETIRILLAQASSRGGKNVVRGRTQ